jgi:predicted enzyme related to lactoylglutathione lyase
MAAATAAVARGGAPGPGGPRLAPPATAGGTCLPCHDEQVQIKTKIIVFDAPDLAEESTFWAELLSGTAELDADGEWATVFLDGKPYMGFQLATNYVAPQWPGGPQQQQIHLDLYVDDVSTAHEKVIDLGAKLLQAATDLNAAEGFQVYADPAGHPFCLCWG